MSVKMIYAGPFVHSESPTKLDICLTGAIGVDETGKIAFVKRDVEDTTEITKQEPGWEDAKIVKIGKLEFFFPGFIDTHIHASQYPNAGIFGKSTLLDWLNKYTFPLEASFKDVDRAAHVYKRLVSRTLSHGTTCAAYYATIHVPATNLLADICLQRGQRALVGRVCMDSMGPDYYKDESAEEAIEKTKEVIAHIEKIDPEHEIVVPCITPRFAPACTSECLTGLGELHKKTGYPTQTHISENVSEVALVAQLFPNSKSYAAVYDDHGLLTDKTILAHAVHLSPDEIDLVRTRNAKISHCPSSNTALTSGRMRVRNLVAEGIDVGLGTDVSGGFSASVLEVARQAIWVSRHVAMPPASETECALTVEEVLYLATRGGAKVVGLKDKVGGFEVGKEWDAQMITLTPVDPKADAHGEEETPVDVFGWEEWEDIVHKWVFNGDDRNTAAVWVKGKLVHSTSSFKA